MESFASSRWLAGETLGLGERLILDGRELSASINMRFLYDPERRLFSVGYNVSEGRLDSAYNAPLAREAAAPHIAYGRQRRVPWGISESAFGDLDLNKTYQYKAFGVPELGLKRGLEEKVVVSPYATDRESTRLNSRHP